MSDYSSAFQGFVTYYFPFIPRRIWKTVLVILVFYAARISPFEFGFLDKPSMPIAIIDNLINAFVALDIIAGFLAGIDENTDHLVDEPNENATKHAFSFRMLFDVISVIPYELIQKIFPASGRVCAVFNIFRLWRLRRIHVLFSRMEKNTNLNYYNVRCTKLLCVTLFAVHSVGCFYYYIAAHRGDIKATWIGASKEDVLEFSIWTRYVMSVYRATTALTTVRYGDLNPVNEYEMVFNIFFMVLNLGLLPYLIANITNLVACEDSRTRKYRDSIQAASTFAERNNLPSRLRKQMLAHISLRFKTEFEGVQQLGIPDSLPKAIRSSISVHLFYTLMNEVYLFRGVSSHVLFQLVSETKVAFVAPNEDVILRSEAPTDFYIVVNGAMDLLLLKNGPEEVIGEAKRGNVFGEIGVLCCRPQPFTVRAKRTCQLLRINRTVFLDIVQVNATDVNIIMNNLLEHVKSEENGMTKDGLEEIEKVIGQGKFDLPVSSCFAAKIGDEALMRRLLKQGVDPNESEDTTGRTALHIASSNGHERCVRLLLQHGADPNCRDQEEKIPLWGAMLGNHKAVEEQLREHGAYICACDRSRYTCIAAEKDNLDLIKKIVQYSVRRKPTPRRIL